MENFDENVGCYNILLQFPDLILYSETADGIISCWSADAQKLYGLSFIEITEKNHSIQSYEQFLRELSKLRDNLSTCNPIENFVNLCIAINGEIILLVLNDACVINFYSANRQKI